MLQIIMLRARNYPVDVFPLIKGWRYVYRHTDTLRGSDYSGWAGILEKILFKKLKKRPFFETATLPFCFILILKLCIVYKIINLCFCTLIFLDNFFTPLSVKFPLVFIGIFF